MTQESTKPLARVFRPWANGRISYGSGNSQAILRQERAKAAYRIRSETRISVLGIFFLCFFLLIGGKMSLVAISETDRQTVPDIGSKIAAQRADITDRHGRILATNFETYALYGQPQQMVDPEGAAAKVAAIFPDLDHARLLSDFTGERKFVWIKRKLSPEQRQAVHDLGEPGLLFGPREVRLYPNGHLAAHVLGGASFGKEGVSAAEVIGVAGVEKYFDQKLRDPARSSEPLKLSIDLAIQDATERVLLGATRLLDAKGATSVLMDVHSGEVLSLASLPDFDPNDRPPPPISGEPSDSPLFNRAAQGVYELGSAFKIFTAAQAIDLGIANEDTIIDASGPMEIGRFKITEFRNKDYGRISLADVIVKSSNRGVGRLALKIGAERQKAFLDQLGMLSPTPLEVVEAASSKPLYPRRWSKFSTVTISYGHGISTTPLHLAVGYATIANGGKLVQPTILRQDNPEYGPRVLSPRAAATARAMLRRVVTEGTASLAQIPGYQLAGKTGTAEKPKPGGGYLEDKVLSTFATIFPADNPKYVLVVTLDEPVDNSGEKPKRTAGWTAVPVAAELVERIAPLLGLRPYGQTLYSLTVSPETD